jgi:hypothetical protein
VFNGRLLAGRDAAYLADDFAAWQKGKTVRLLDYGRVARECIATLPAGGGGVFVFDEAIEICGRIATVDGEVVFVPEGRCTVRGLVEITIDFDGQ